MRPTEAEKQEARAQLLQAEKKKSFWRRFVWNPEQAAYARKWMTRPDYRVILLPFIDFPIQKLPRATCILLPFLVFLALAASLLSSLNPFSNALPWIDSSVFLTIGREMHNGLMPYRDFFDHKGPLLYVINYVGMFAGRAGVWACEVVFLFIFTAFTCKTARIYLNLQYRIISWLFAVLWLYLLSRFFTQGNMPEEYAMAFIAVSLFFYARHFYVRKHNVEFSEERETLEKERGIFSGSRPGTLGFLESAILGGCFAWTLLLKINLAGLWIAFSIVLLIRSIQTREWKFLRTHCAGFAVGAVAAAVPFLLWLAARGAFSAWLEQTFLFNAQYSASVEGGMIRFAKNIALALRKTPLTPAALLVHLFLIIKCRKSKDDFWFHTALAFSILLTIALFAKTPYLGNHYFLVLLPLCLPALALCVGQMIKIAFYSSVAFCIVGVFFTGLLVAITGNHVDYRLLVSQNLNPPSEIKDALRSHREKYTSYTHAKLAAVRAATPQDARSVVVVGSNCNLYFASAAKPASRYLYQWPLVEIAPRMADEFQRELWQNPPELIYLAWPYVRVTYQMELDSARLSRDLPALPHFLSEHYELLHSEPGLALLYKRKTPPAPPVQKLETAPPQAGEAASSPVAARGIRPAKPNEKRIAAAQHSRT